MLPQPTSAGSPVLGTATSSFEDSVSDTTGNPNNSLYLSDLNRPTAGAQTRTATPGGDSTIHIRNRIGGWFNYAYGFTVNHPLMAEHIHINKQASINLIWLEGRAMPGVELHSATRAPPPRCYRGTRLKLIKMIQSWLRELKSSHKLLWLSGPAGIGKSAIMQTLAESEEESSRLGASIFFPPVGSNTLQPWPSPLSGQDTPPRFWITVSYRLATKLPSYLAYVQERIGSDPTLVDASMERQFDVLIAEPFGQAQLIALPHLLSIFIDGLDHFHTIDTQKRVAQLIVKFIQDYPLAPLVWVIAARREPHLVKILGEGRDQGEGIHNQFVPVGSSDALADVKFFMENRFNDIRVDYEELVEQPWPNTWDFSRLLLAASVLFLFADAVMNFIANPYIANPMTQFKAVLSAITPTPSASGKPVKPLEAVHNVYARILGGIPSESYLTAKRILGFLVLPVGFGGLARDATPFWYLCNILNITKHDAYSCLRMLHSLLDIPAADNAVWTPIRPFHPSFPNYLANPEASERFWISPEEAIADLWQCHFRVLQEINAATDGIPRVSEMRLSWSSSPKNNEELRSDAWENARRALFHHLLPCPSGSCPYGIHYADLSKGQYPLKLIEVLGKINFRIIMDGYVPTGVPYRFVTFLDWLTSNEHAALQEERLLRKLDITNQWDDWIERATTSFKINVSCFDDGDGCTGNKGRIVEIKAYADQCLTETMDPNRPFSTGGKPEPLSELLDCLTLGGFSTALVVGSQTAGQCAILAHKSLGNDTFYVLPYKLLSG